MASVKQVLYTSKTLTNGEHPIMIRVIKDRKIKYYNLGHSSKLGDWNENDNMPGKKHPNQKRIISLILQKLREVNDKIAEFETNNQEYSIEHLFDTVKSRQEKITVFKYIEKVVDRLIKANKVGNAEVYKDTLRELKKFRRKKDFEFSDVSPKFLNKFEEHFRATGKHQNGSISIYMRTLRAIFNKAIEEDYCKQELYPFKKYKISKLKTKPFKRALSLRDIKEIEKIECDPKSKKLDAKNYFLFSFYNRGINFTDMALLKWDNIININNGSRLKYNRSKTGGLFNIELLEPAKEILKYYKENFPNTGGYIFPILDEFHKTEVQKKNRVKKIRKEYNKNLRALAIDANVDADITSYVSRHSWAMAMRKNGVDISIISQGMGHQDERTTRIYLEELENSVLDEASRNVLL